MTRLPGSASGPCFADPHSRLAPPLRSTGSAAAEGAALSSLASALLRAGPTSPSRSLSATASGLPGNVPSHDGRGQRDEDLPVPEQRRFCVACRRVYDDAGASMCLKRYSTPWLVLHFLLDGKHQRPELVLRRSILPRLRPPPVGNASRLPSRAARASLRAGAVRYAFTVTDFHRLLSCRSPRRTRPDTTAICAFETFERRLETTWGLNARAVAAAMEGRRF